MPSERPEILVVLGSYLPAYKAGGPIRSVANLVAATGEEFHFRVLTLDRDLGDKLPFRGVVTDRWIRVGNADVMYQRPGLRGLLGMCALLCSVERNTVLYLNSFFARRFSMLVVLMCRLNLCRPRRVVLAPRGEFSPGALQLKPTRKRLFINMARLFGLCRGLVWHASSELEAADIRRQFPESDSGTIEGFVASTNGIAERRRISQVAIALDLAGPIIQMQRECRPKMPGELRLLFVSRLAAKKNLAGSIRMLNGVSGDVSFDIYGPAEDSDYWEECQGLIASLPPNIQVNYRGHIEHAQISQIFANHDLFLFPTLGENYGHVICEALVSGCPVLISDQTPWRNLEEQGVGWDLPLSEPERFRRALRQCVEMPTEEHSAMCARAAAFGARCATDPAVVEQNRLLFRVALGSPALE